MLTRATPDRLWDENRGPGISADLRYGCLRSRLRDRGTGLARRGRFQEHRPFALRLEVEHCSEPVRGGPEIRSRGTTARAHIPGPFSLARAARKAAEVKP